jgi:hypothetical protein
MAGPSGSSALRSPRWTSWRSGQRQSSRRCKGHPSLSRAPGPRRSWRTAPCARIEAVRSPRTGVSSSAHVTARGSTRSPATSSADQPPALSTTVVSGSRAGGFCRCRIESGGWAARTSGRVLVSRGQRQFSLSSHPRPRRLVDCVAGGCWGRQPPTAWSACQEIEPSRCTDRRYSTTASSPADEVSYRGAENRHEPERVPGS